MTQSRISPESILQAAIPSPPDAGEARDTRMDQVDAGIDLLAIKLDRVDSRMDRVDSGIDLLAIKLDRVDARMDQMDPSWTR